MAIRDLLIFAIVFGSIPFILWRPYVGVLIWSWLAYMNPHRLTWSLAFDFAFSQVVAAVLLVAVVFSKEPKRVPWTPVTGIWLVFFSWTGITTLVALYPEGAAVEWSRWWKINLISLISLLLMRSRYRLHLLVWVIAASIGFFGVKGGLFAFSTAGQYMVLGPELSFIGDNTSLGLALIMILPFMRYLQIEAEERWLRWALAVCMALTALSILATQSRGAFLGLIGMGGFLIMKSQRRVPLLFASAILMAMFLAFMPASWHERIGTIRTYEEDGSALGRINAWWFAVNLAKDRPLVGGGFNTFNPALFHRYAPDPDDFHDSHSIYFEVLGEQGFIGLALFLALGWLTLRSCAWTIRHSRDGPDLQWARNLAAMTQVSMVGYAVAGAFLGLAYFDLYYHLIVIAVLTRVVVQEQLSAGKSVQHVAVAQRAGAGVPQQMAN